MINKHLKILLAEHKRVIIPGFGALVVRRSASGDLISFDGTLQLDDDLLMSTVMAAEELEREQAVEQIEMAVTEIKAALTQGESYEIKGVGFLTKDKKDNIRFMKQLENTPLLTPSHEDEKPLGKKETDTEHEKLATKKEASEAGSVEVEKTKKHHKTLWLIIIIITLALLIGIFIVLGGKLKNKFFFHQAEQASSELVTPTTLEEGQPQAVMTPNQIDTIKGIPVVADRDIAAMGEERYNVMLGSFSDGANATQLNAKLIKTGFSSEVFDRHNGFYAVSLGKFSSLEAALKKCEEKLNTSPDIWILVK